MIFTVARFSSNQTWRNILKLPHKKNHATAVIAHKGRVLFLVVILGLFCSSGLPPHTHTLPSVSFTSLFMFFILWDLVLYHATLSLPKSSTHQSLY